MFSRALKYYYSRSTGRLSELPVLILMPHSRCNCKCVMCDIWKANAEKREITMDDLAPHLESLKRLNVRHVVFSGGEALMHSNLWALCYGLKSLGCRLTLLSTGLLLKANAGFICTSVDDVIVSLDGSRDVHDRVRRIAGAYEQLEEGVRTIKHIRNEFRIAARSTLHRQNYFDMLNIIDASRDIGVDQISFLAADVSSEAFNRAVRWPTERVDEVALSDGDIAEFERIVEDVISRYSSEIQSGFIAEAPEKLRRIPAYYAALRKRREFPSNSCNAPWVSAVVETDGNVRPCFFHPALGNIHDQPLEAILNNSGFIRFRKNLNVSRDAICKTCVCTLRLRPFGSNGD